MNPLEALPLEPLLLPACPEKRELIRIAAQRIVDSAKAGRAFDEHALAWAQFFVAHNPPLQRQLGTGEPAA